MVREGHDNIVVIMNCSVIYMSSKGGVKRIADAIAAECGTEAQDASERHVPGQADLLFIGTGIYSGKSDPDFMNYLDNLPLNTIRGAAVFSVSKDGLDHTELVVNLLRHKGIAVYPVHFTCLGQTLFRNRGRPNSVDLVKARDFARKVLDAYQG